MSDTVLHLFKSGGHSGLARLVGKERAKGNKRRWKNEKERESENRREGKGS